MGLESMDLRGFVQLSPGFGVGGESVAWPALLCNLGLSSECRGFENLTRVRRSRESLQHRHAQRFRIQAPADPGFRLP